MIVPLMVTATCCCAALAAFRSRSHGVYVPAKALASAGFVTVALFGGALDTVWGTVAFVGLVLAAFGDVAIAASRSRGFLAGLACFAAAYCSYSVAFVMYGVESIAVAVTCVSLSGVAAVGAWRYIRDHLPERLRPFVMAYFAVMALMLGLGVGAAYSGLNWALMAGVVLVATSDIAVARERFVHPSFANKMVGLPAYYGGQTLIALAVGVLLT